MEPARYEQSPLERVPQPRLLAVELGGDPLLAQGRHALRDIHPAGPAVAEVDAPPVDSPLTALQTRSRPSGQLTSPISGCGDRKRKSGTGRCREGRLMRVPSGVWRRIRDDERGVGRVHDMAVGPRLRSVARSLAGVSSGRTGESAPGREPKSKRRRNREARQSSLHGNPP
jgi:hypothetical protein